jgi:N12 class adenine-specific DNA methylase
MTGFARKHSTTKSFSPMTQPYDFTHLEKTGGVKLKLLHNISAVKLLSQLEQENRQPTSHERDILARFVGWGTVANVINREVLDLLPNADLNSDNAFQTSKEVIEAIWAVVEHLGFKSGRVLEPAANIGLFPGFQNPEYRSNSEWVLCEIDPTAAAIARHLHPDAIVYGSSAQQRIGFEHADVPAESFDLVVSNFPFGLTAPFDPKYSGLSLSLHNYFWRKSFDLTATGGILAAITSVGTLDSSPEFCQYLAGQGAYLIGAVRLPNNAFRCMNTSVTADLIILQKRSRPQSASFWGEVVDSGIKDRYEVPLKINRYFTEHPERVLGTLSACTLYGNGRIAVTPDGRNLKQSIIDAFSQVAPCYSAPTHSKSLQQILLPAEFIGLDAYRYVQREGRIYQYRPGVGLCLVAEQAERIAAGLRLKVALDSLVKAEIEDAPNCELHRGELNRLYNQFVKRYGNLLNRRKRPSSLSVFQDDSELTTMCYALEEEIPGDVDLKTGKIKSVSYKKADIFKTRVSGNLRKRDRTITTPTDALYECLERRGHLDLKFIAALLDKTESEASALLKSVETPTGRQSLIFYDMALQRWVMRDEYLSGDTRTKLSLLRTLKELDPEGYSEFWLHDNATELTLKDSSGRYIHLSPYLLPPATESIRAEIAHRLKQNLDLDSELDSNVFIDGGLASPWVEANHVLTFTASILGCVESDLRCQHVPELGLWALGGNTRAMQAAYKSEYAASGSEGKGQRDVLWLIQQALNQTPIKIQVYDGDEIDRKASTEATDSAIAQTQRLKHEFKTWLWSDLERAYNLTLKYNTLYPLPKKRVFDGSYLTLPDSNTRIKLRPHQLNAVARAIASKRLFLLHEVGTGKTFSCIAAAYEAKRLGIANKPILVVLNSTLSQIVSSFKALYPTAKLLVADDSVAGRSPGSFKERNKLVAKIQTGSYDAIILTHTQFFGIPISTQTKLRYIQEQLDIVKHYLDEAKDENDQLLSKELRRQSESLTEQIEELETIEAIRATPAGSPEFEALLSQLLEKGLLKVSEKGDVEYVQASKRAVGSGQEPSQKELDKKRARLNNSVERATNYYARHSVAIDWESLGCDWLMFDEIHVCKNISFVSKITGTAGITNTDTQRSLNTLMKFRHPDGVTSRPKA